MFAVVWIQSALNELTTLWTDADSPTRQAITAAAHLIDEELLHDPQQQGESREEDERVFFAHPLGITFEVDADHSTVRVLHVWDIRRKR